MRMGRVRRRGTGLGVKRKKRKGEKKKREIREKRSKRQKREKTKQKKKRDGNETRNNHVFGAREVDPRKKKKKR